MGARRVDCCNIAVDSYAPNQIGVCIQAYSDGFGYMNTTLAERCRRIGLTKVELARRAGLDHTTVARALRAPDRSIAGNLARMRAVVETAEKDLLAHLSALHGTPLVRPIYAPMPQHGASAVAGAAP